jgi:transposase
VKLGQRTYNCYACGLGIDRDLNSALNILNYELPAVRREFTPVDTKASIGMLEYFNSIPGVSASLVEETGSLEPSRPWVAHL